MTIQPEIFSIVVLTGFLSLSFVFLGKKVNKLSVLEKPTGVGAVALLGIMALDGTIIANLGKKNGTKMAPFIGVSFLYILFGNLMGLVGLETPTSNLSVTLVFGFSTFAMIQIASIKMNGLKGYAKGFFEPIFPFVIPNFFGAIAPLISLSLRLFGNVVSGGVIMGLFYMFTEWVSSMLPVLGTAIPGFGTFNIVGVVIGPVLHLYFDLFSAFLQAFIFMSLTTILLSVEYGDDE